jgi:hypothetical protein
MTKEKLEKEAENWLRKYLLCCNCEKKCNCIDSNSYCEEQVLQAYVDSAEPREKRIAELEKENAELRKVAEFQQSSNMNTHLENKKLKEGLTVGSMWNKHLNSQNKALEEERDRYRNMTFDQREQLTKAKDHIKKLLDCLKQDTNDPQTNYYVCQYMDKAEQFLKDCEVEK